MANKKDTTEMNFDTFVPAEEKMVTIKLPRITGKDEEDEVVWVNERRFLIKKGVPVDVPESVALILEQKDAALAYLYDYQDKIQK